MVIVQSTWVTAIAQDAWLFREVLEPPIAIFFENSIITVSLR